FNERQKAVGLLGEQAVMEVFASEQGTWTILTTDTNGTSCIVAAGDGWDATLAELVGQGVYPDFGAGRIVFYTVPDSNPLSDLVEYRIMGGRQPRHTPG